MASPNCFNARELGHSIPRDIRRIIYWNVFAGAFGQSYGCHAVWQMYDQEREPINQPLRPWSEALELPKVDRPRAGGAEGAGQGLGPGALS